jgi:hypothetical protein
MGWSLMTLSGKLLRHAALASMTLGFCCCAATTTQTERGNLDAQFCMNRSHAGRERYPPGVYQGEYYPTEYVAPNCHPGEHAECRCDHALNWRNIACQLLCVPGF